MNYHDKGIEADNVYYCVALYLAWATHIPIGIRLELGHYLDQDVDSYRGYLVGAEHGEEMDASVYEEN